MCCQVALAWWRCIESFFARVIIRLATWRRQTLSDQKRFWRLCYSSDLWEDAWFAIMNSWWRLQRNQARLEKSWQRWIRSKCLGKSRSGQDSPFKTWDLKTLNAKVGDLSGGLRRRVTSPSFVSHHDLLLPDEPTNYLDIDTIEWLIIFEEL